MGAAGLVGDPGDRGVGQHALEELEFARARLAESAGDGPDRAVVQVDPEVVVGHLLPVAQVALGVEQFGDPSDAFFDGRAGEVCFGVVDESLAAPVEDPVDEIGMFVLDEFEEFDREVVGGDEQRLGALGGVVAVGGPPGLPALLAGFDQSRRPQAPRCWRTALDETSSVAASSSAVASPGASAPRARAAGLADGCSVGGDHAAIVAPFGTFARKNL